MLFFNWFLCVLIGLLIDLPVRNILWFRSLGQFLHSFSIFVTDLDGSHGVICVVRLVQTEQGRYREFLVRHPIQGNVLAMGSAGNEFDSVFWVNSRLDDD